MKKGIVALVVLVGVYVATTFFSRRLDMWRFPWAYEGSGRPTLTGTWVGSLTTATGQRRGVIMEMHLPGGFEEYYREMTAVASDSDLDPDTRANRIQALNATYRVEQHPELVEDVKRRHRLP